MGNEKYTIQGMHKLAKKRGGECLSTEYVNCNTKLKWRCKQGHTWEAKPMSIINGKWCGACARVQKLTIQDMHKLAEERGGECLSAEYVNNRTKLQWRCKRGHIWESIPSNILEGEWCNVCNGLKKLTIDTMKEIAKKRGGVCLSETYVNIHHKLLWQCEEEHIWEATPNQIKNGRSWCPECAVIGRSGVPSPEYDIEDMRELAKARGGKCLSVSYKGMHIPLRWQCGKGHIWEAEPNSVKRGHWCPICARIKKIKNFKTLRKLRQKVQADRTEKFLGF